MRHTSSTTLRRLAGVSLAASLGVIGLQSGPASAHTDTGTGPATSPASSSTRADEKGGWKSDGLFLNAADNRKVDRFLDRARHAERSISPQVRAAAARSGATVVGFESRLKSPDSLKRKVATFMKGGDGYPPSNVTSALGQINDAVRYTLGWATPRYTQGVRTASRSLADFGNNSVRWSNTWDRKDGYKAINSTWSDPAWHQKFEVQFHTGASKAAQETTHKLYEEQRLPSTSPQRKRELQAEQARTFAAVPVPAGATELTAPARRAPAPAPGMAPAAAPAGS